MSRSVLESSSGELRTIALDPLDRLAVSIYRESKLQQACSLLGFSGPVMGLLESASEVTASHTKLAAKAHPKLVLEVVFRGCLEEDDDEELNHGTIDARIEEHFKGKAVLADSESDAFWCYCSKEMKPELESWLRSNFPALIFSSGKNESMSVSIHGLGSQSEAERWCESRGLEASLTEEEKAMIREAVKAKTKAILENAKKKASELELQFEDILAK